MAGESLIERLPPSALRWIFSQHFVLCVDEVMSARYLSPGWRLSSIKHAVVGLAWEEAALLIQLLHTKEEPPPEKFMTRRWNINQTRREEPLSDKLYIYGRTWDNWLRIGSRCHFILYVAGLSSATKPTKSTNRKPPRHALYSIDIWKQWHYKFSRNQILLICTYVFIIIRRFFQDPWTSSGV